MFKLQNEQTNVSGKFLSLQSKRADEEAKESPTIWICGVISTGVMSEEILAQHGLISVSGVPVTAP